MEDKCPICGENRKYVPMQGRECLQCCRIDYVFEHTVPVSATMPDDDEPITEEWWHGYATHDGDSIDLGDYVLELNDDCRVLVTVYELDVETFWATANLPAVRTRGDVRQLVKLLGRQ